MLESISALAHAFTAVKSHDAAVPLELDEVLALDELLVVDDALPPLPVLPPLEGAPAVPFDPPPDVLDDELEDLFPPPPRNTVAPVSPSAHALPWRIANARTPSRISRMQGRTSPP
jgi:hypothetical protein